MTVKIFRAHGVRNSVASDDRRQCGQDDDDDDDEVGAFVRDVPREEEGRREGARY